LNKKRVKYGSCLKKKNNTQVMAKAATQHEEVPHLMKSEYAPPRIGALQRINYRTNAVENTPCNKPGKTIWWQSLIKRVDAYNCYPSHEKIHC